MALIKTKPAKNAKTFIKHKYNGKTPVAQTLTVTAPGTYTAPEGVVYDKVIVTI